MILSCVFGGWGSLETSSHLFLHCCYFGPAWHFIHCWLGVSSVLPVCVADQFSYVGGGGSKGRQSIIQLIWYASVWEIWKQRNNRLFDGKECSIIGIHVVEGEMCFSSFQLS